MVSYAGKSVYKILVEDFGEPVDRAVIFDFLYGYIRAHPILISQQDDRHISIHQEYSHRLSPYWLRNLLFSKICQSHDPFEDLILSAPSIFLQPIPIFIHVRSRK